MIVQQEYSKMTCSECGITYYFPDDWLAQTKRKGRSWHCPNGHSQWYGPSEVDKLRQERDRLAQRIAQVDDARVAAERKAAELESKARKLHTRTFKNGVCPCCNRSFQRLAAHLKTKHPEYVSN